MHDLVLKGGRVIYPQSGFDNGADVDCAYGLVWGIGTGLHGRDVHDEPGFIMTSRLLAYLKCLSAPVKSLIQDICAATHPDTRVLLIDDAESWKCGVDLTAVAPHCDDVIHCAYSPAQENIASERQISRKSIGENKDLIAGLLLTCPEIASGCVLNDRATAALKIDDGCTYCNYGLFPNAGLDRLNNVAQGTEHYG